MGCSFEVDVEMGKGVTVSGGGPAGEVQPHLPGDPSHLLMGENEESEPRPPEYPQQAPPRGPNGRIFVNSLDMPPTDSSGDGTDHQWTFLFRSIRDHQRQTVRRS